MNVITPPIDEADTWLGRTYGLRASDAARFHGQVRIRMQEGLVFAQHHDSEFRALDWECIYRDANGRAASRYKRGARKGIVFTPPQNTTRLIVTLSGHCWPATKVVRYAPISAAQVSGQTSRKQTVVGPLP